jgi:hypothetical protein
VPADVMYCEAEAGAATPKVRPCRTHGLNQPKPRRIVVVLVARCCARVRTRQTGALTRGRRCKLVCGLSEGPLSCYCLRFECVVGQGGRVLRTHSPEGQTLPKINDGHVRGEGGGGTRRVRSAHERAAEARRLIFMSMPSFGGVGALRGGDHEH